MADAHHGIIAYGAYVPAHRLTGAAIAAALGTAGGRGARAIASFDEDTTSMGVEAARAAMDTAPPDTTVTGIHFATTTPAYLDKTNATAIHAALALDSAAYAVDLGGAVRSGIGALRAGAAMATPTLVVLSDLRSGLPGSADERDGGDGAAALLVGRDTADTPVIAELIATASATSEFLDRWRIPGEPNARVWEERFGEQAYLPLVEQALTDLVKQTDVALDDVDHVVVVGTHARAMRKVRAMLGDAATDDLGIGNTGTAHVGLALADVLDRAEPGQLVAVVSVADGADVLLWRTTDALPAYRRRVAATVRGLTADAVSEVAYATYLTWRGLLRREPPRRPDPFRPESPSAYRERDWKYAFAGSRCTDCAALHLPGQRVCVNCHAVDHMAPESVAGVRGRIATFTVDRLAYSLNPPVVVVVVDFDGGGRYQCEMTDVDPATVAIGDEVEMTFRRMYSVGGVHNYFWKARPARTGTA